MLVLLRRVYVPVLGRVYVLPEFIRVPVLVPVVIPRFPVADLPGLTDCVASPLLLLPVTTLPTDERLTAVLALLLVIADEDCGRLVYDEPEPITELPLLYDWYLPGL